MTAPAFQVKELVRVRYAEHTGRWGQVDQVIDFRETPDPGIPKPDGCDVVVMVVLKTARGKAIVNDPPEPVPFAVAELAPLFDATGVWARRGRVVSRRHWPAARTGLSEVG